MILTEKFEYEPLLFLKPFRKVEDVCLRGIVSFVMNNFCNEQILIQL